MVDSIATSNITSSYQGSILRSQVKKTASVKFRKMQIGLVGNSSVGKTSLIRKFVKGDDVDGRSTISTIGVERT
jgi:GTPase SAR1 family protein